MIRIRFVCIRFMAWNCSLPNGFYEYAKQSHTHIHLQMVQWIVRRYRIVEARTHNSFICTLHVENLMVTSHSLSYSAYNLTSFNPHSKHIQQNGNANSYWVQFNRMLVGCFIKCIGLHCKWIICEWHTHTNIYMKNPELLVICREWESDMMPWGGYSW